jgi:hypothetical protein
MKQFFSTKTPLQIAVTSFVAILLTAGAVVAATTLGTNISTTGTLTVTPASNSTASLTVNNASSKPILEVDTTNSRASTTEVIIPQANVTTPRFNASSTAISVGDGSPVAGLRFGTCTVTLGSITASTTLSANCTATGVTTSDKVFVTPYITDNGIIFTSASSTANNTIQVSVFNVGLTGAVNPADLAWPWMAIR